MYSQVRGQTCRYLLCCIFPVAPKLKRRLRKLFQYILSRCLKVRSRDGGFIYIYIYIYLFIYLFIKYLLIFGFIDLFYLFLIYISISLVLLLYLSDFTLLLRDMQKPHFFEWTKTTSTQGTNNEVAAKL